MIRVLRCCLSEVFKCMPRYSSTCSQKDDYRLQLQSFGSYSERNRNFRFVITAGWPVSPPDVVWEMLINLLMKSGLLLSAINLRESLTLEGIPAFQMTANTSCNESNRLHLSLSILLSSSKKSRLFSSSLLRAIFNGKELLQQWAHVGVYVCLSLASQICKQYRVNHVERGGSVWLQLLDRRKRCLNCSMRRGGRQLIVPGSVKGESHFIVQSLMLNMLPAASQSVFEAEHVSLWLLFTYSTYSSRHVLSMSDLDLGVPTSRGQCRVTFVMVTSHREEVKDVNGHLSF